MLYCLASVILNKFITRRYNNSLFSVSCIIFTFATIGATVFAGGQQLKLFSDEAQLTTIVTVIIQIFSAALEHVDYDVSAHS